ncbi:RING-H2 finger protein ATL22 [Linum grandiflorum]
MKAQIFPLHFLLFFFLFTTSQSSSCPPIKCNPQGPEIHYPFRETTHHHPHCGRGGPGFDLTCHHNTTTVHFDSSIDLLVKSIDYADSRVDLVDPRACVHEVFMDLNLTGTPFQYAYKVEDFEYLNCSTRVDGLDEVGCLSGEDSHVYTLKKGSDDHGRFDGLRLCKEMKTVAIPFGYSPYLADDGFGLGLIWTVDNGGGEIVGNGLLSKGLSTNNCRNKWLKVALCIVLAALLAGIKMYCHTNRVEQQLEEINRRSHLLVDHSLKRREGVI